MVAQIGARALEDEVGHQPTLIKAQIVETLANRGPGEGIGAIAAHHPAGLQRPGRGLQRTRRIHGHDLGAGTDLHIAIARHTRTQRILQRRLMKAIGSLPALRPNASGARPVQ
jgi:hypothetical protein